MVLWDSIQYKEHVPYENSEGPDKLTYSCSLIRANTTDRAPDKIFIYLFFFSTEKQNKEALIFCFFMKTYVAGTHEKCLGEALLMSTHNIRFYGEIRKKYLSEHNSYLELCCQIYPKFLETLTSY